MKECRLQWHNAEQTEVICEVCKRVMTTHRKSLDQIHLICGKKEKVVPPPILTRISNFGKAAVTHFSSGGEQCAQEAIDKRFNICKECPLFIQAANDDEAGICGHKSCGCNLNRKPIFLNKLSWTTQECPIGKWDKC